MITAAGHVGRVTLDVLAAGARVAVSSSLFSGPLMISATSLFNSPPPRLPMATKARPASINPAKSSTFRKKTC